MSKFVSPHMLEQYKKVLIGEIGKEYDCTNKIDGHTYYLIGKEANGVLMLDQLMWISYHQGLKGLIRVEDFTEKDLEKLNVSNIKTVNFYH